MRRSHSITFVILSLGIAAGLFAVMVLSAAYLYLSPKLPDVDVLRDAKLQIPLRIYSQNGQLLGEFGEKLRTPVRMDDVPDNFVHAILAAEDDRFLKHQGIDIAGLVRAAWQLVASGEIKTGGSTITMQVARNFFLSREKTFLRKFNEILLALQIERELEKFDILELYINKIYLGKRAYGFQAAANVYYGRSLKELGLAQIAMLAGLPKAPSANNPISNPSRALARRNWILGRMLKLGHIDQQQHDAAVQEEISAFDHGSKLALNAGYAAEMARGFAIEQFGLGAYTDGLQVITTLDTEQQLSAQTAVRDGLRAYDLRHGYRGAEQHVANRQTVDFRKRALEVLRGLPTIIDLQAAVVLGIGQQAADTINPTDDRPTQPPTQPPAQTENNGEWLQLLFADGSIKNHQWRAKDNALRPYRDANRRGRSIESIAEVLQPGDVIRVETDADRIIRIAQLPEASAALVALNPNDGAIRALVGGLNFSYSKFNRATQAYRQPGSNFKPFIYAAAFANGYTAATTINDAPIVFNDTELESDWRPENSSGKFYGPTTLRRALYLSRNLVSVRLLREMGIGKAIQYLNTLQLSDKPLPRDLSLALGSYAMTPLQVASAYAMIANGGFRVTPYLVAEIRDRDGSILYRANPARACATCTRDDLATTDLNRERQPRAQRTIVDNSGNEEAESLEDILTDTSTDIDPAPIYAERLIDPRVAFLLDNILQDVIKRGTGTGAQALGRNDLAGKTGTTNGPTDAWFSGYHPSLVTTTWLGFDDNGLIGRREFGASAALPIWIDFMRDSLRGAPSAVRQRPEGLTSVRINRLTGEPATPHDTDTAFEFFRSENVPALAAPGKQKDNGVTFPSFGEELF